MAGPRIDPKFGASFSKGFSGQTPDYIPPDNGPSSTGQMPGGGVKPGQPPAHTTSPSDGGKGTPKTPWEDSLGQFFKRYKADMKTKEGRQKWFTEMPDEVWDQLRKEKGQAPSDGPRLKDDIELYLQSQGAPQEAYDEFRKLRDMPKTDFDRSYRKKKDDYVPLQSNKPKSEPKAPVKDFWEGYDGDGNDKEDKADQITEQRNKPMVDYSKTPNDKINATSRLKDLGLHGGVSGFSPELMKAASDPRITDEMLRDLFKKTHKQAVLD